MSALFREPHDPINDKFQLDDLLPASYGQREMRANISWSRERHGACVIVCGLVETGAGHLYESMKASGELQRSRLAMVTLGHFLNDCYGSFFAPFFPYSSRNCRYSLTMASGLASIPSITSSVFQPLYGMASDRIRGRFFILMGPLLSIVCMGLIGVVSNAVLFGILLLLAGIGAAALFIRKPSPPLAR